MFSYLKENKVALTTIVFAFLASIVGSILLSTKILYSIRAHPITTATLHTSEGDIKIRFLADTPKTVENFIKLSQSGFYNNTHIHRIVSNTLIQGGDPLSKFVNSKNQWGKGGPGYTFPDETNTDDNMSAGAVAMANSGPNTNGSQFFILAEGADWLEDHNTIFAYVDKGMDVVKKIAAMPIGLTGIPVTDIKITGIDLE